MSPRVASLLPAATEIAYAVGAGDDLVGVSHECDFPPEVRSLPVLTRSRIPRASERETDRRVRELAEAGDELYRLDVDALRRLAPDVVLTQDLCDVCAVSPATVKSSLAEARLEARVVVLRADSLAGVARDAIDLGEALGRPEEGHAVARSFEARLAEIRVRTADLPRPRVASLEWLDPPFAAGHWVPQMVRLAGGEEVLGEEGRRSRAVRWADVEAARPDVLCVLPCGFDLPAARRAWERAREALARAGSWLAITGGPGVLLLDANGLFSRPGPRLVRGVEVLAALLHPGAGFPRPHAHEGSTA